MPRKSKRQRPSAKLARPPQIAPNEYFSLEPVAGKGLGLIAKCDIKAGTRILIEDAMVSYDVNEYDAHDAIWSAFCPAEFGIHRNTRVAPFTKAQKEAFFKLAKAPSIVAAIMEDGPKDYPVTSLSSHQLDLVYFLSILQSIARVNQFDKGVYEVASRLNHSCSPNCDTVYSDRESDVLSVYTIENVKKGEELTINYYPRLIEPHDAAVDRLLESRDFLCVCSFCTLPPPERRQLTTIRERIRRLSEDFSFVMYRIEPKRTLINQLHGDDIPWGRIPHKRAIGPLPLSVIDSAGNIQLDAACAELDQLLEKAEMHGTDVMQLYLMMSRIVSTFAETRSLAKSGKACLYASKWWNKYIEEAGLMGGFSPEGRECNERLTQYLAEKCRQLR